MIEQILAITTNAGEMETFITIHLVVRRVHMVQLIPIVMPGLVPGIHGGRKSLWAAR